CARWTGAFMIATSEMSSSVGVACVRAAFVVITAALLASAAGAGLTPSATPSQAGGTAGAPTPQATPASPSASAPTPPVTPKPSGPGAAPPPTPATPAVTVPVQRAMPETPPVTSIDPRQAWHIHSPYTTISKTRQLLDAIGFELLTAYAA